MLFRLKGEVFKVFTPIYHFGHKVWHGVMVRAPNCYQRWPKVSKSDQNSEVFHFPYVDLIEMAVRENTAGWELKMKFSYLWCLLGIPH